MFSELGSLLLITGQQTASQGHEQCVVAEQRAFSPESVRLSMREREREIEIGGEKNESKARERGERTYMFWVLGIDCRSALGHHVS